MKPKNISKQEYIKTFCRDQRIRSRKTIYVSTATHDKLRQLAKSLHATYTSTASLVDSILSHHLETYREPIEKIITENKPEPTPSPTYPYKSDYLDELFREAIQK